MNFEAISYRNMVYFYQDQLEAVLDGDNATDIFTVHQRRGLRRKGIIKRGPGPVSKTILTPKAIAILDRIREDVTDWFIDVKEDWDTR